MRNFAKTAVILLMWPSLNRWHINYYLLPSWLCWL